MPRELKAFGWDDLRLQEYEPQKVAKDQVRVRTEFAAAKHGTEMAAYKGYGAERGRWDCELGLFIETDGEPAWAPFFGNMFVGRVEEVGAAVEGTEVGDRVCGYGGFREVHVVGAGGLREMSERMPWQSAVCLDPADFAMAAMRDGNVRVGDAVAIFGMGAIGLMCVQIAAICGAHPVIAIEPLANRRRAAEACGADLVLDPTACDAGVEIKKATEKRGADVCIEYSGNVQAMQHAIRGVAYAGRVVAGAYPPPYPAGLDFGAEAHLNIPTILFSRACSEPNREHPRWDEARIYATCWRLLCEGRLTGEPIVEPVVPFEELPDAYLTIAHAPETNIKLGARF